MLLEFTVGNYRSFKEPATLSMVAANTKARDPQVNENNTIVVDKKLTLLTSTVIYGANASGKSNFIKAMGFMRRFVITSSKESVIEEPIRVSPFRLSTATENKPSFFEVVFLLENVKYRYGFEANHEEVVSEWLFAASTQKEMNLFIRDETGIHISRSFKEGKDIESKTRPNVLFLSAVAQWNGQLAGKLLGWFRNVRMISGLNDSGYKGFTIRSFEDGLYRKEIVNLVKTLDLGIEDITSEKMGDDKVQIFLPENLPADVREAVLKQHESDKVLIQTAHKKFDDSGLLISSELFNLQSDESDGTEKLFYMTGPLLDVLSNGSILFIDEMEARLHPLITRTLIGLFNSKETNPKRAQLIFTTHDTNLLSNKTFRRDQIWFVEKDRYGSSHLYSLAEIKVRNDRPFENDYIEGRYGAIPFLGNVRQIIIGE
jgi:AAA15 family ATPase/GTPase